MNLYTYIDIKTKRMFFKSTYFCNCHVTSIHTLTHSCQMHELDTLTHTHAYVHKKSRALKTKS